MSFSIDLAAFGRELENNLRKLERGILIGAGEELVMRSPVGDPDNWLAKKDGSYVDFLSVYNVPDGYVGGRFRANWQYGLSVRPLGDLPDIDKTGKVSKDRIKAGAKQIAVPGNVHYITNNLPYAQKLENGWSHQAPNGMVAITTLNWQRIANEQARLINP